MNDTQELRDVFRKLLNVGHWSPKSEIKYTAGLVADALKEWKHANNSLYYDAKSLSETKINKLDYLIRAADSLKLELYKFILYLEENND